MIAALAILALALAQEAPEAAFREEARRALRKAVDFYRTRVARHGGYVYYTSLDLAERWGEGKAGPDQIWVQPPGTPTVGMAYLAAWEATKEKLFLDAAREAVGALVYGQLESGGWTNLIDFNPAGGGRVGKYRGGKGGNWNVSSLDDGQTPSALRFLIRMDRALEFRDGKIHEAVLYGLEALLKAQFPNGGFPQVWTGPVPARPVVAAGYPDYDWKTERRVKNYWDLYTLNDGIAGHVFEVLAEARAAYGEERFAAAIRKLGDFLVLAQMPDPQPAWAQQYTEEMRPAWARKFEPPALASGESQDVIETLVRISLSLEERKYLDPVPRALEYLRKSLLPDGRLARFYELRTNRPLYMDAEYRLTYDDSAAPDHYGWKVGSRLGELEKLLAHAREGRVPSPAPRKDLEREARRAVAALDSEGRWVSTYEGDRLTGRQRFSRGFRYLDSAVFSRNVELLAAYLAGR
jgi:hypothetical protein